MKNQSIILFSLLLLSTCAMAYQWDSIGPGEVKVHNFCVVNYNLPIGILCTDAGIMIHEGNGWTEYSNGGLPAWDAHGLDPNNILVLLGNGSYSDGVYKFNLSSHQFEVLEYIYAPNFFHFCDSDSTYYTGGENGVWKSTDGTNFILIDYFDGKKGLSFAWYENHYIISSDFRNHYSSDFGLTWNQTGAGMGSIPDMKFHPDGTLYGIFPGNDYSAGLWKSFDYGETWDVEYYNMWMSAVDIDAAGHLFLGWESEGVALRDPATNEMFFLNGGLPDLHINKITIHPNVAVPNIVACTDNGAFILTDYPLGVEETQHIQKNLCLKIYPNPVVGDASIEFLLSETTTINLSLYRSDGQKLVTIFKGTAHAEIEYARTFNRNDLAEGVYYLKLRTDKNTGLIRKLIVVD